MIGDSNGAPCGPGFSWLGGLELSSLHNGSGADAELVRSVFHLRDRMLAFPRARDRTATIARGTSV